MHRFKLWFLTDSSTDLNIFGICLVVRGSLSQSRFIIPLSPLVQCIIRKDFNASSPQHVFKTSLQMFELRKTGNMYRGYIAECSAIIKNNFTKLPTI